MSKTIPPRRANHAPLDLDVINAKCVEEGDCWNWLGAIHCGMPVVRHAGKVVNVRRFIAQHLQGLDVKGKLASTCCRNPQCCAPEHVDMITRLQLQRRSTKATQHQSRPSRNAKLAAIKRAGAALDEAKVAEIRASNLPGRQLAEQYGVTLSTVQRARNYLSWRDYTSPFAGLMA